MAGSPPPPQIDPILEELIEKKVAEKFASMQQQFSSIESQLQALQKNSVSDRCSIMVFSGDMDRLMTGFIIGTGAVAMGMKVDMYFTFWGLTVLKKDRKFGGKTFLEKVMQLMLPVGPTKVNPSRLSMMGMGRHVFKKMMDDRNVESLSNLVEIAQELEINLIACQMAMGVMGISPEELIDGLTPGGIATYLGSASDSKITLFV